MEDNQNSTIRILVDALTKSLNELSQRITNYKPVLDRIGTQTDAEFIEIKDIINHSQNIIKNLDILTGSFFERSDTIIKQLSDINTKIDDAIKTLDETNKIILETDKNVKPIGKFTAFISKPMGFIIFIIGMIIASYTISTCWTTAMEYFYSVKNNVTSQQNSK